MKREQLNGSDSVAELFKVTTAKGQRRLVRLRDALDWELVTQILQAAGLAKAPHWPADPVAGLLASFLARSRPTESAVRIVEAVLQLQGGWDARRDNFPHRAAEVGLSQMETGSVMTLLRLIQRQFPNWDLAPLRQMGLDVALRHLAALPGMDHGSAAIVLLRNLAHAVLPPTHEVRLVLARLGVLPSGVTDSKALQSLRSIPAGVPLAELYQGLVGLYEEHCHGGLPGCGCCPLRLLCPQGRKGLMPTGEPAGPTVVDLFAGAGGMSLGLQQAGFRSILAVEKDPWAAMTYRTNHPEVPANCVLVDDITRLDPSVGQEWRPGRSEATGPDGVCRPAPLAF